MHTRLVLGKENDQPGGKRTGGAVDSGPTSSDRLVSLNLGSSLPAAKPSQWMPFGALPPNGRLTTFLEHGRKRPARRQEDRWCRRFWSDLFGPADQLESRAVLARCQALSPDPDALVRTAALECGSSLVRSARQAVRPDSFGRR